MAHKLYLFAYEKTRMIHAEDFWNKFRLIDRDDWNADIIVRLKLVNL